MYRVFVKSLIVAVSAIVPLQLHAQSDKEISYIKKAERIHKSVITIDTHNDTALNFNDPDATRTVAKGQVTFPMMAEGGLDAAFFAIYIGQGPRDEESNKEANFYVADQLLRFKSYVENSDLARVAYNSEDIRSNKRAGKISVILALENGYPFGKDISQVER
ncbi:MAG: hypothetical protein EOM36_05115, partial [Bacteroidia bacterium]|nr:hypothetical protein [Bacteroidia bacterium]